MYREKSEPAGSKHCSEMGKERYKQGSSASESADGDIKDIAQQRVDELLTRLALSRRNKEWLAPRDSEGRSPESRDQVGAEWVSMPKVAKDFHVGMLVESIDDGNKPAQNHRSCQGRSQKRAAVAEQSCATGLMTVCSELVVVARLLE